MHCLIKRAICTTRFVPQFEINVPKPSYPLCCGAENINKLNTLRYFYLQKGQVCNSTQFSDKEVWELTRLTFLLNGQGTSRSVLNLEKMLRLSPETKKTVLINKVFVLSGCS